MKRLSIWIHDHPVLCWAILLAGISLLLRVLLWLYYPPVSYSDTGSYHTLASAILSAAKNLSLLKNYDGTRTPGYPAFMAIFGPDRAVYAAQLALGFLITMGFFYIGWQITHKPELGFVLGLAHTLNMGQLFFEADLISETVATFWLFLAVFAAFIWLSFPGRRNFLWLVIMGVATGLATLTRPVYIFMPFWLVLWLGVSWSKKRLHIDWRPCVGILVPAMLIIGGWTGETYAAHRILGLTTTSGYNLIEHTSYFFEYVPDKYAAIRDTFIRYRNAKTARVGNPGNVIFEAIPEMMKVSGLTFYDLSILLEKISIDLIIHHPFLYMRTVISGWWYFWRAPIYWKPARFAWPGLVEALKIVASAERVCLASSNMIFLATTLLAACSKKLLQVWQINNFLWLLASAVWVTSILQTLPDHGDNPRFLVPTQTWVVFWVLWLIYQTINWIRYNSPRSAGLNVAQSDSK